MVISSLSAAGIEFAYAQERILNGVDLTVAAGETVALVGESGSGKSTLLHVLAGLIRPDDGIVSIDERDIGRLNERERAAVRLRHVGLVTQFGDLLPELDVVENVALPLRLLGQPRRRAVATAMSLLDELGIGSLGRRRLSQISGGQLQRAAIARALVHNPSVMLADEPTGSLDRASSDLVVEMLVSAAATRSVGVVVVTHDASVAASCSRQLKLAGGRLAPLTPATV